MLDFVGLPSLQGLDRAIAVIIVSEIGDKTFLIAAILAMRHPRLHVFGGAFAALAVMSILSALLGHVLPTLLPRRYTTAAAAVLFFVFGARMIQEAMAMQSGTGKIEEELKEVEAEVEEDREAMELEAGLRSSSPVGNGTPAHLTPRSQTPSRAPSPALGSAAGHRRKNSLATKQGALQGLNNLISLFVNPIVLKTFVLTFLAEWGDRSQITTIALAAASDVTMVTIGTIIGHSLCTVAAVFGGKWLATKISVKHVTYAGAVLFLVFGLVYSYEAYYDTAIEEPLAAVTPS